MRGITQAVPLHGQRYRCLRKIATGGMAEVFLARAEGPGGFERAVVIKRVLPHLAAQPEFVEMFLNEANIAAGLHHSNTALVFDFGCVRGSYFLVMEYCHGRTVRDILYAAQEHGPIPLASALHIVRGVAAALHHAHEAVDGGGRPLGIVHRDVSPSNVMVSYAGEVKLLDFGIAKATEVTRAATTGAIRGKVGYMSPEQVQGRPLDRRSDVYSLGILLYELTTSHRAFHAQNEFAMLNMVALGAITPPSTVRPGYPPMLEKIALTALCRDREHRFPSAREFMTAIEAFADEAGLRLSDIVLSNSMVSLFGKPPLRWAGPAAGDSIEDMGPQSENWAIELGATRSAVAVSGGPWRRRVFVGLGLGSALAVGLLVGRLGGTAAHRGELAGSDRGDSGVTADVGSGPSQLEPRSLAAAGSPVQGAPTIQAEPAPEQIAPAHPRARAQPKTRRSKKNHGRQSQANAKPDASTSERHDRWRDPTAFRPPSERTKTAARTP